MRWLVGLLDDGHSLSHFSSQFLILFGTYQWISQTLNGFDYEIVDSRLRPKDESLFSQLMVHTQYHGDMQMLLSMLGRFCQTFC